MTDQPDSIIVEGKAIPVWPEGQPVRGRGDNVIAMTTFLPIDEKNTLSAQFISPASSMAGR